MKRILSVLFLIALCSLFSLRSLAQDFGNGIAGDQIISGNSTYNHISSTLSGSALSGSTTLPVNSTFGFFAGDPIFIIQMANTIPEVGNYEEATISAVNAGSIEITSPLTNDYQILIGGQIAQVIKIPQFRNFTLTAGSTLSVPAWDGSEGGIFVMKASGRVDIQGDIDLTGTGFTGGNGNTTGGTGGSGGSAGMGIANSDGGDGGDSGTGGPGGFDTFRTFIYAGGDGGAIGGVGNPGNNGFFGNGPAPGLGGNGGNNNGSVVGDTFVKLQMGSGGGGGNSGAGGTGAGGGGAGGGNDSATPGDDGSPGGIGGQGGNGGQGGTGGGIIFITAYDLNIDGNIASNGADGQQGGTGLIGGNGGNGGDGVTGTTFTFENGSGGGGGDGAQGGQGGQGGGAGGGGSIWIRTAKITNNGTVLANGGNPGTGGTGGAGGNGGIAGIGGQLNDGGSIYPAPDGTNGSPGPIGSIGATAVDNAGDGIILFTSLPDPLEVRNTNDTGDGSLRNAIDFANFQTTPQTITFNIPGGGPHVIQPNSPLPAITNQVLIDGYTQPGATENFGTTNINSDLRIIINGQSSPSSPGLNISADNSEVKGLSIINFNAASGIAVNANNVNVNGCFIGVREDGTTAAPNDLGITISNVSGSIIGGAAPNLFNLISSNATGGIHINSSIGNFVQGNFIGTDNSGTTTLAGGNYGVQLENSSGNVIGGSAGNAGNLIANQVDGIIIQGTGSTGNDVFGNFIGTNDLNLDLQNTSTGIYIHSGANNNKIGDVNAGEGNTIAYHPNHGILIEGNNSDFNSIRGNAIYCSGSDNISLGTGSNENYSPPVIGFVSKDSISGNAAANDIIDLYRDISGCPMDGATEYITSVNANGSGFWFFSSSDTFYPSDQVVGIATNSGGNSSPFSLSSTIPIGFNSATLSTNNAYVDLEFDFPAYGDASSTLPVGISNLVANFTRNGGETLAIDIIAVKNTDGTDIGTATDLSGGEFTIRVFINISSGFPRGVETISFSAANDGAIFDESGSNLLASVESPEVTFNPAPRISNTTLNFDICSGSTTNINLLSDIPGSSFSWTATDYTSELSGFTESGSGISITETISNSGINIESITFTTNAVYNEIEGPPVDIIVDVNPIPVVIPSIPSDTICSATSAPVSLSSTITPLTSFTWTASGPSYVTGYNNSGGPLINQVLSNTGNSVGNVTYSVTPVSNGCNGTPLDITVGVKPVGNVFFSSTDMNICNSENTVDIDLDVNNSLGPWSATINNGTNDFQESSTFAPFTFADLPVNDGVTQFSISSGTDDGFGVSCPLNITGPDINVTKLANISVTSPITDTTICETQTNVRIPLSFNGVGPWNITYSYNNVTNTTTIDPDNQFLTISALVGSNTLSITDVVDVSASSCPGEANVDVVINKVSALTASLSLPDGGSSASVCQNENIELSLTLTGDAPWEVVLLRGTTQQIFTFDTPNQELEIPVTGNSDFVYSILSVTSIDINCVGSGFGTVNVNVVPLPSTPTINSLTGSNSVCEGATNIPYSVTSINNASSYQWSFTNGVSHSLPTSDDNSNSIFVDYPQDISGSEISVSGVNGCGTGPAITLPVRVNLGASDPGGISGQVDICQNTSNVTYSIPSVDNATGYVWDLDYTNNTNDRRFFTNNPNLNINFNAGFEGAVLQVAAYNNCDTSDNRSVLTINSLNLPNQATTPEGPVISCTDSEITLTVQEISGATQYEWYLPGSFTPIDGNTLTTSNSIIVNTGTTTGVQNINVAGINDCGTGLRADSPLRISVQTSPEIEVIIPESAYLGAEVQFTGVENSGQDVVDWQWSFGDGNSGFGTTVTHIYEEGGMYTVTLTVANSSDCQITSSGDIEIINELPVTIMNVITANNDGSNDGLYIEGVELFPKNEVIVFNRMGIQILNIQDYRNNWQEATKGTHFEEGNYVVIFKVKGTDLSTKQTVSILK